MNPRDRLAALERVIAALERRLTLPGLEHAHLGRVGSGGGNRARRALRSLNRRRERLDRLAARLGRLYAERQRLRDAIADEEARTAREVAEAQRAARIEETIRAAGPGCQVVDCIYGLATVVRVNRKSVTIETPSGYREARPFRWIVRVLPVAPGHHGGRR